MAAPVSFIRWLAAATSCPFLRLIKYRGYTELFEYISGYSPFLVLERVISAEFQKHFRRGQLFWHVSILGGDNEIEVNSLMESRPSCRVGNVQIRAFAR